MVKNHFGAPLSKKSTPISNAGYDRKTNQIFWIKEYTLWINHENKKIEIPEN